MRIKWELNERPVKNGHQMHNPYENPTAEEENRETI
jgi:hypothetical protein